VVDWNDNTKRKAFRLALQRVYPNPDDLRLFVDEELNENLAVIAANNNLQVTAHDLVAWARAKGRLDEVFQAFCNGNPSDPVIAELQQRPLIDRPLTLMEEDWRTLFEQFSPSDFADIQRAFLRGFQRALDVAFQQVRPDHPPLTEPDQIQALLVKYDNPKLAVRFVESAISEIQRSHEGKDRDLTALGQWRDRIAQQHHVPPLASEPAQTMDRQGYLLIAFEESGSDVIVYPELRVTGKPNPIEFGVSPVKCLFGEVPDYLSDWIYRAEEALDGQHDGEILLELFLPCALLEEDLATTWEVKDRRNRPIFLGMHRLFVVRSFDRLRDDDAKRSLERKWKLLHDCVRAGNACDKFHLQEEYIEMKGALFVLLKDALGLKSVAKLPPDREKREEWLYEIIDAAVPIALWSPSVDDAMLAELKIQMNNLSRESRLTNFVDLAYRWQAKLARSETASVKHIRLLCDCPDRLPNLPDPDREEDLLVA
jgi:hypothetical protein